MSTESTVLRSIRLRMAKLKLLCLRYTVGTFFAPDGTIVHVGEKGVSDLIGITPHVVTQEDVGRTVGIFTALEVKRPKGGRVRAEQGPFLRVVNANGGLGAVVRSEEEAEEVVRLKWDSPLVRKWKMEEL